MKPFLLRLENGALLSGTVSIPARTPSTPEYIPLIIAIHGGTYSSKYYDASSAHSAGAMSEALGVPFVAFDRPGYIKSTALPPIPHNSSFFQEEGRYLQEFILPKLWAEYGMACGVSTIVLMGHSLGVSSCIIAGALRSQQAQSPAYPLDGMVLEGRSMASALSEDVGDKRAEAGRHVGYLEFPPGLKQYLMFNDSTLGLASKEMLKISQDITERAHYGEIMDRRRQWPEYWERYAAEINIPLMIAVGQRDRMMNPMPKDLDDFSSKFMNAPKVEQVYVLGAPHCLELSHWGPGWYARCFGFAIECATSAALA
jgi:pimeloyl-ACP methyl ester carboxylesterase